MTEIYRAVQYTAGLRPTRPDWSLPDEHLATETLWILAIDPGITTGICLLSVSQDSIFASGSRKILHRESLELTGSLQNQVSNACYIARALSPRSNSIPAFIVCEDFDIGGNSLQGAASEADVVTPIRWGAALRYAVECGHADRSHLIFQGRTIAFGTATDDRLKKWDMWDKGSDHKRDATRHAITMLRRLSSGAIEPTDAWELVA